MLTLVGRMGIVGTPFGASFAGGPTYTYTVPAGKTLYLESYYYGTASNTYLTDASNVVYSSTPTGGFMNLTVPIPIAAGKVLHSTGSSAFTWGITGYLTNSNGLGGP